MTHSEKRCDYCGHTYYHQGSGEGCLDRINNAHYCPRCMKIIIESLDKLVPKEDIIIKSAKEIDKKILSTELLDKMERLKSEYVGGMTKFRFSTVMGVGGNLDFDNIEIYRINRYTYYICWNDNDEEDKHYFQDYEYYSLKKEYTAPYKNLSYSFSDSFSKGYNMVRALRKMTFQNMEVLVPKPSNNVVYMPPEWTIDTDYHQTSN